MQPLKPTTAYIPISVMGSIENGYVVTVDRVSVIKNFGVRKTVVSDMRLLEKQNQYIFSKEELTELLSKIWDADGTEHETSKGKMFEQFILQLLDNK